jgi:hypothetical protein
LLTIFQEPESNLAPTPTTPPPNSFESPDMSQSNNPFDQNPNAPGSTYGGAQTPYGGAAPYGNAAPYGSNNQPPKKSALPWILGILGVLGFLGLLCCGGLAYVGYKAKDVVGEMAGQQIRMQVEDSLNADPNFSSNIGTIETMSMDIMAIGEANQGNQNAQGQNTWLVFNVTGSNGSGVLKVKTGENQETFTEAVLVLPDGQELPVDLSAAAPEESAFDIPAEEAPVFENDQSFIPADNESLQLDPK